MTDAQLTIREDVMGNIFGRWEGVEKAAGAPGPDLIPDSSLTTPWLQLDVAADGLTCHATP